LEKFIFAYIALERKGQLNGEIREIGEEFHTIRAHLERAGTDISGVSEPKT